MLPLLNAVLLLAPLQGPPGYYNSVDLSSPTALRSTLHAVIDDHVRFPYSSSGTDTWNILELADEDPGNSSRVLTVYHNRTFSKQGGGNPNYDREHTWPSSYGFPSSGSSPYTDCHQLRLSDSTYNGARGNRPYGPCPSGCSELTTDAYLGVGGGSGVYPGNSNWASPTNGAGGQFETWSDRRGDAARSLLYLDVRYDGSNHGVTGAIEPNLVLTDNQSLIAASAGSSGAGTFHMGYLATLLAWHAADPVDAKERDRNDVVFSFQNNRNPFVDHPEWIDCLFNGSCVTVPTLTASNSEIDLSTGGQSILQIEAGAALGGALYITLGSLSGSVPGLPFGGFTIPLNAPDGWFTLTLNGTPLLQNSVGVLNAAGQASSTLNLPAGLPALLIGRTATQATVLLSSDGFALPLGVTTPADVDLVAGATGGALVINEVDYDQPGTDTTEFIELYNGSPTAISLTGLTLELVNGSNGSIYDTIALGGLGSIDAGQYLVIGSTLITSGLPSGTLSIDFGSASNNVQNGAPDAMRLLAGSTLIDAVSYEGVVGGSSEGGSAGTDSNSGDGSLQRQPNGADTDNNSSDFAFVGTPTPGAAN